MTELELSLNFRNLPDRLQFVSPLVFGDQRSLRLGTLSIFWVRCENELGVRDLLSIVDRFLCEFVVLVFFL